MIAIRVTYDITSFLVEIGMVIAQTQFNFDLI